MPSQLYATECDWGTFCFPAAHAPHSWALCRLRQLAALDHDRYVKQWSSHTLTWLESLTMSSIVGQTIVYICQFCMCAISKPSQWEGAQALFVVGSLALNIVNSFYAATFPSIVRDLPKMIESEEKVKAGTESPEAHNKLDAYERSKVLRALSPPSSLIFHPRLLFYTI